MSKEEKFRNIRKRNDRYYQKRNLIKWKIMQKIQCIAILELMY